MAFILPSTARRRLSRYYPLALCFVGFFLWTVIVIHFAAVNEANKEISSSQQRGPSFGLRPRGVKVLKVLPIPLKRDPSNANAGSSKSKSKFEPAEVERPAVVERVDGFENPNGLPKLPRLGPPSFFEILAPPYYGKSPVDGSRNFKADSKARTAAGCPVPFDVDVMYGRSEEDESLPSQVADHLKENRAERRLLDPETPLCSFGPEEYTASRVVADEDEMPSLYAAYQFHQVCMTFNTDSSKRVQRGLIYFDPLNSHAMRCVACPNPIEMQRWGDHACGLMWNHQINAKSLRDFANCHQENLDFSAKIGQRQSPASELKAGIFYSNPTLALSFAHKNPGHQMFDSIFTLMPLLVAFRNKPPSHLKLAVHQMPSCPDTEWFCAILRRIGFMRDDNLVPMFSGFVTCFKDLIVPKWGIARSTPYPPRLLRDFRDLLFDGFGLDRAGQTTEDEGNRRLLLYAHDTKSAEVHQHRRIWLEMKDKVSVDDMVKEKFTGEVRVIDDFAKLSTEEQALSFNEADVIAMPHGGQFGNAMFARPGTLLIELVCSGYSHLGMTNGGSDLFGAIPRALGLVHVVVVPCSCANKGDVDSDFTFGPRSLLGLIDLAKNLSPGTHSAAKLVDKRCYGSAE